MFPRCNQSLRIGYVLVRAIRLLLVIQFITTGVRICRAYSGGDVYLPRAAVMSSLPFLVMFWKVGLDTSGRAGRRAWLYSPWLSQRPQYFDFKNCLRAMSCKSLRNGLQYDNFGYEYGNFHLLFGLYYITNAELCLLTWIILYGLHPYNSLQQSPSLHRYSVKIRHTKPSTASQIR